MNLSEQKPQSGSDTYGPIIWRPEDHNVDKLTPEAEVFKKARSDASRLEATRLLLRKTVEITGSLLPKMSTESSATEAVKNKEGNCQASTKVANGLLAAHDIESDVIFDGSHFWGTKRVGRDNWYFDGYFGLVGLNKTTTDSMFVRLEDPKVYDIDKANIGLNRIKRSQREEINLVAYDKDEGWTSQPVNLQDGVELSDSPFLKKSSDRVLFVPHDKAGIYLRDYNRHRAAAENRRGLR